MTRTRSDPASTAVGHTDTKNPKHVILLTQHLYLAYQVGSDHEHDLWPTLIHAVQTRSDHKSRRSSGYLSQLVDGKARQRRRVEIVAPGNGEGANSHRNFEGTCSCGHCAQLDRV